jgi:hypothetical protein
MGYGYVNNNNLNQTTMEKYTITEPKVLIRQIPYIYQCEITDGKMPIAVTYGETPEIAKSRAEAIVNMQWIDVDENPPHQSRILISYRFGVAECRHIDGKYYTLDMQNEFPDVTDWMPLPKPTK